MSLHEYLTSQAIAATDPPFYALIMAAMRAADSSNLLRLKMAWPHVWEELQARYHAPLGLIPGDNENPELVARSRVDAAGRVTIDEGEDNDEDESTD
jgi:hypothetical protein